jgi:hypothetical protein
LSQFSGLTELSFGLVLIVSVLLYFQGYKLVSVLVISFLPFARTEGVIILIIFGVFLLFKKEFKYIPLLLAGSVIYSIVGYYYYEDIFWIINENPYRGAKELYGSGDLLAFADHMPHMVTIPIIVLLIIGLLTIFVQLFTTARHKEFFTERFFLIYGCAVGYFVAHSIFWWQGWFSSLGLGRVLIGIMPLMALIAIDGLNSILQWIPNVKLQWLLALTVLLIVVIAPFRPNKAIKIPHDLTPSVDQQIMHKISDWYYDSPYKDKKVIYNHPYFMVALKKDPFDPDQVGGITDFRRHPQPDSTLIIWDKWFTGIECGMHIDTLLADNRSTLLRKFEVNLGKDTVSYYVFRTK